MHNREDLQVGKSEDLRVVGALTDEDIFSFSEYWQPYMTNEVNILDRGSGVRISDCIRHASEQS